MTMFRGAAVSLIYNKALLTQDGLYDESSAAITLMSTDVDSINSSLTELNECWARAIEVSVGIVLLSLQLGWVSVIPVALVLVSFFAVRKISSQIGGRQKTWVDAVEKRIAITSSILADMRSIKMMGLSPILTDYVQNQRVEETIKQAAFRWSIVWQNVVQNWPWALAPSLTFAAYAAQAAAHGTASIDVIKAFTSLSIITLLTDPAAKLLSSIPGTAASIGCVDRVQKFLISTPRKDYRNVVGAGSTRIPGSLTSSNHDIELRSLRQTHETNCSLIAFDGVSARPVGSSELVLHDVSFEVSSGSVAVVIGAVGSGKSTLLKTILGEAICERGSVTVGDNRMAFCSQKPWMPNGTVRGVICGASQPHDTDTEWYNSVLRACALEHDMSLMPNGDQTRIGSGGIILSGGQKQRVSLARAVYSRNSIVVLDDILSALDRKTQREVLENLLGQDGLFRKLGATVIMTTNEIDFLSYADKVLLLSDSQIRQEGTYEQFVRTGLAKFLPRTSTDEHHGNDAASSKSQEMNHAEEVAQANEINDLARRTGDRTVYKYYLKTVGWRGSATFMGFTIIHVFAVAFSQIWLKWWADNEGGHIGLYISIFVLLSVLNSLGNAGYAWSMLIQITPSVARKLHFTLLKTVMRAPQSFFAATDTGSLLNRFSQDMALVETQLATGALITITNLLDAMATTALIASGSVYMSLTIPLLVGVVYMLQHVYLRTSRQLRLLDLESRTPLYSQFLESLDGLSTIRAFGWSEASRVQNRQLLDTSQRPNYMLYCIQRWLNLVLDLIVAAEAVIVVGLALGLRSTTSVGLLGVSLNNILAFNGSLSSVIAGWTLFETSLGSIARVRSFEQQVQAEDKSEESEQPFPSWPDAGDIKFQSVDASHNPSATAVHDICLQFRPGTKIGICGRTGSGKSSLIATLVRLLEIDRGQITIDGVDLATISRDIIRERLVIIPQDPLIISASLRLNLDPQQRYENAAVIHALERVGLWTMLRERGDLQQEISASSLSNGQRQLLALARAILKKGKVVLLDEPTSSVDRDTDKLMQKVLREEFAESTVLTVAHRMETIFPGSDTIVVMDRGRVAEVGTPAELLKKGGMFAQLVDG